MLLCTYSSQIPLLVRLVNYDFEVQTKNKGFSSFGKTSSNETFRSA